MNLSILRQFGSIKPTTVEQQHRSATKAPNCYQSLGINIVNAPSLVQS
ncbi:hypothetical protein PN462_02985 [Spirulina sp. CS-785/01]|nr:hypothetical protein [Spirulina sp. CS-785/01]MDB9312052.1 hypothetical protein [Spirulina sp. CS-785/01]